MCFCECDIAGQYDPCNKPDFCNSGDVVADPDNCERFYDCPSGHWRLTSCEFPDQEFDNGLLQCVDPPADCAECPEYTGPPTPSTTPIPPGEMFITPDYSVVKLVMYT